MAARSTMPTRRTMFAGAAALPAIIAASSALALPSNVAERYRRNERDRDNLNATFGELSSGACEARCADVWDEETAILAAPIATGRDAAAIVLQACRLFEAGERTDGLEEAALRRVAAWLGRR